MEVLLLRTQHAGPGPRVSPTPPTPAWPQDAVGRCTFTFICRAFNSLFDQSDLQ